MEQDEPVDHCIGLNESKVRHGTDVNGTEITTEFVYSNDYTTSEFLLHTDNISTQIISSLAPAPAPADVSIRSDDMSAPESEDNKQNNNHRRSGNLDGDNMGVNDPSRSNDPSNHDISISSSQMKQEESSTELHRAHPLESGTTAFDGPNYASFNSQAAYPGADGVGRGMGMPPYYAGPSEATQSQSMMPYQDDSLNHLADESNFGSFNNELTSTQHPMMEPGLHFPLSNMPHLGSNFFEETMAALPPPPGSTVLDLARRTNEPSSYSFPNPMTANATSTPSPQMYSSSMGYGQNHGWNPSACFDQTSHSGGVDDMNRRPPAINTQPHMFPQQAPMPGSTFQAFPVQDRRQGVQHEKPPPGVAPAHESSAGPTPDSSKSSSSSSFGMGSSPTLKRRSSTKGSTLTSKKQRTSQRNRKMPPPPPPPSLTTTNDTSKKSRLTRKRSKTAGKTKSSGSTKAKSSNVAQVARRGGNRILQRYEHTEEEWNAARTPRKQGALISWYNRLNDLIEYKNLFGDTNVPQKYVENRPLGIWVNKQRMEKKARDAGEDNGMTPYRIGLLESVGFIWAKKKGEHAWQQRFAELKQYKKKHGNCNVLTKNSPHKALGRWVSTQRSMYKKYNQGKIPNDVADFEERIRLLDEIGFSWSLAPGSPSTDDQKPAIKTESEEEEEEAVDDYEPEDSFEYDGPDDGHDNNEGPGNGDGGGGGGAYAPLEVHYGVAV